MKLHVKELQRKESVILFSLISLEADKGLQCIFHQGHAIFQKE